MAVRLRCLELLGALLVFAGCGPKYPRLPAEKAALIGMVEDREAHERDSSVRGRILRLDGRVVKMTKEEHVDPGCHLVEVEVQYSIQRPGDPPCPLKPLLASLGVCDRIATYESGRRHFAIRMRSGRRYELSALINEDGALVYFVEVDAELGTVARFVPVHPDTTECAPGIAL